MTQQVEQSKQHSVKYGQKIIDFELSRSERKTLGITVYPDKRVGVVAPYESNLDKIYEKVHKRAPWIIKQQDYFEQYLPMPAKRQYVSGETHHYLGRQYRLKVLEDSASSVKLYGKYFYIAAADKNNINAIQSSLEQWYRDKAKIYFKKRIAHYWPLITKDDKPMPQVLIRKMDARWGSYSPNHTITLNLRLIQAPSQCIDYVVVHELCHGVVAEHNKRFYQVLSKLMPDWEKRKQRLEKCQL